MALQPIVIAIEAIKETDGRYFAYTDNGREHTGVDVISWAKEVAELGAGEICITSVDMDGTGLGYDLELTKMVAEATSIPVIAHGGAGSIEDVQNVIQSTNIDAVAIASILHYGFLSKNVDQLQTREEGNFEFLKKGAVF